MHELLWSSMYGKHRAAQISPAQGSKPSTCRSEHDKCSMETVSESEHVVQHLLYSSLRSRRERINRNLPGL